MNRAANYTCPLLPPSSYPSWFCTWSIHLHIQQKFGAWSPASHPLSVLELVSFRGKFPCPGETGGRSSFPGFVPLFIVILPSGCPEQFPSPPLRVHPSNGFRIWHWKIKFKKKTPNTQGIENIQIYCSAFSSLHHCLRRVGTGPDFFLIANLNYSTGHRKIKPYKSH